MPLPWTDIFFYAVDLSTFSTIWYWLALAVTWAVACYWVLGVPFDILIYGWRYGAKAAADIEKMVDVNSRRLIMIMDWAGPWIVGTIAFVLSALAVMGFIYRLEFAQGLFLLSFPMIFVGMINLRAAHRFQKTRPMGKELARHLFRLRIWIQCIAAVSIFFTASYGMYFNLTVPVGF